MTVFNWGILGTGNIAGSMAEALRLVPNAKLLAAASRTQSNADRFAATWQAERAYSTYDALMADPDVDIVYIATPNACHKENILNALCYGKHVLCEKPMTLSEEDTRTCARAAQDANLFLMEAMWTAFFPAMRKLVGLVQGGAIGTPRHFEARFMSFRNPATSPNLFDPKLGGGASLDLGIYPIAAALMICGPVTSASAEVLEGASGVDEMVSLSLVHKDQTMSQLSFGFRTEMPISLRLTGDFGHIAIPETFHHPSHVHVSSRETQEDFHLAPLGFGYAHEAIAVQDCIAAGLCESEIWPLKSSIECARLIDRIMNVRN